MARSFALPSRARLKSRALDLAMYLFLILPAALLLAFTIFYPVAKSAWTSLLDVSLLSLDVQKWNSFAHYRALFTDFFQGEFWHAFQLSNLFAFSVVLAQFALGLVFALLLNEKFRGVRVLRSLLLMPWVIPTAVTALLWMWLFQPDYGVLNYLLKAAGLIERSISWLGGVDTALLSVMLIALWKQLPFMTIMLLAGMQSIPSDVYEAAAIDGASRLQTYAYVVLPYLRNVIRSTTLVAVIENFKMFPLFWLTTQGGPIDATTTLSVLTYQTSFVQMDLGRGAAIGVLWTVFLVLFSQVYNRLLKETILE